MCGLYDELHSDGPYVLLSVLDRYFPIQVARGDTPQPEGGKQSSPLRPNWESSPCYDKLLRPDLGHQRE